LQTFSQALEAVESYSPAEEHFNRRRRTTGLVLGPLLFVLLLAVPLPLPAAAHRLSAIFALVVVLWITEALPVSVTALLGPILAVVLRVADARTALAAFADPIVFLFIGSFMLAQAMFVHGLDRRIAYTALSWRFVGVHATRLLLVYGGVAAGLSMWISNTATTAMMFPIGLSIVGHLLRTVGRDEESRRAVRRFALGLMLMTSFAASVAGMATPVGTPPNLIGLGMLERIAHVRISFFQWMAFGLPLVLVLFAVLVTGMSWACARGLSLSTGSAELVRQELEKLGRVSVAQRNVLFAFGITVLLWIAPGVLAILGVDDSRFARAYAAAVPESVAAMLGAILLFLLPTDWRARRFTLTWEDASNIDWGIVLLYGGGLALGSLAFSTGLAHAIGRAATSWLPWQGTLALTATFTAVAIVLSETTSNTASANMIVPVAIAVAQAAGVRPLEPALGATLGASMGFMMPISTAPNAIVYSSGFVPITTMMRYGIWLDIAGFFGIVAAVMLAGRFLF
jgi:sodium-dependent dicarboxylate transporter 2/3/5